MSFLVDSPFLLYGAYPLLAFYITRRIVSSKKPLDPLPPGPPGRPVIGNLLDFPSSENWKVYAKWGETYGDIIHVDVAGQPIIILNSIKHASALFDGRSSIYSQRLVLEFASNMIGWRQLMVLAPDGPHLREQRRIIAQAIGSKAALERFTPLLETEMRKMLRRILDEPISHKLGDIIRKTTGAIILDLTYGYQINEGQDDLLDLVERAVAEFSEAAMPGAHMVDTFPWLKRFPAWLPGMSWKTTAVAMRQTMLKALDTPYNWAKNQIVRGTARSSLVLKCLEESATEEQEFDLKWAALAVFGGGTDTTVSAIHSFFLFMARYPEVQEKAQAEIDNVTGGSRLPTLADRSLLPYVDAVTKEVLRCGPVIPQGGARQIFEDDVYNGYHFPKGSIVISNVWQMLRDPRNYKSPDVFDPTRFLGIKPEQDPREVFGFGRRVCPGKYLADNTIFVAVAMVLAAFKVSKSFDIEGREIELPLKWIGDVVTHPAPFECTIEPRSEHSEVLVRAE